MSVAPEGTGKRELHMKREAKNAIDEAIVAFLTVALPIEYVR